MFSQEVSFLTLVTRHTDSGPGSWLETEGVRYPFEGTGVFLVRVSREGQHVIRTFRAESDPEPWDSTLTFPEQSSNWPLRVAGAGLPAGEWPPDPNVARVLHTVGPYTDMILSTQIFGDAHILAGTVIPVSGWNPPN